MPDRLDFQKLSFGVRRMGWIRFWIQVVLGIVVVGVLLFNNIGGSLARNSERAVGLGPGLSLTSLAFLVLLFSLWQGWLIVRTGRAIDSAARPSRGEVARLSTAGSRSVHRMPVRRDRASQGQGQRLCVGGLCVHLARTQGEWHTMP